MIYLGVNENDRINDTEIKNVSKYEDKIAELNNIISEQEREIDLLKFLTKPTTATGSRKQSLRENNGKSYLKTIEENGKRCIV